MAADALTTIPNAAAIAMVKTVTRAFCLFDMGVSFPILLVNAHATLIERSRFFDLDQTMPLLAGRPSETTVPLPELTSDAAMHGRLGSVLLGSAGVETFNVAEPT